MAGAQVHVYRHMYKHACRHVYRHVYGLSWAVAGARVQLDELVEGDGAVTVLVDLVQHFFDLPVSPSSRSVVVH